MFTARAEYRILLRQDNADERLTRKGFSIGLADIDRVGKLELKEKLVENLIKFLEESGIEPETVNGFLGAAGTTLITQKIKAMSIASRPQINLKVFLNSIYKQKADEISVSGMFDEVTESAEIKIKYEGYIKREKIVAEKIKRLEKVKIPEDINYSELLSISTEGRQKLSRIKPVNIGQAGRISGVSPSDVNILLMYIGR